MRWIKYALLLLITTIFLLVFPGCARQTAKPLLPQSETADDPSAREYNPGQITVEFHAESPGGWPLDMLECKIYKNFQTWINDGSNYIRKGYTDRNGRWQASMELQTGQDSLFLVIGYISEPTYATVSANKRQIVFTLNSTQATSLETNQTDLLGEVSGENNSKTPAIRYLGGWENTGQAPGKTIKPSVAVNRAPGEDPPPVEVVALSEPPRIAAPEPEITELTYQEFPVFAANTAMLHVFAAEKDGAHDEISQMLPAFKQREPQGLIYSPEIARKIVISGDCETVLADLSSAIASGLAEDRLKSRGPPLSIYQNNLSVFISCRQDQSGWQGFA